MSKWKPNMVIKDGKLNLPNVRNKKQKKTNEKQKNKQTKNVLNL